jgi:hypothetical protein
MDRLGLRRAVAFNVGIDEAEKAGSVDSVTAEAMRARNFGSLGRTRGRSGARYSAAPVVEVVAEPKPNVDVTDQYTNLFRFYSGLLGEGGFGKRYVFEKDNREKRNPLFDKNMGDCDILTLPDGTSIKPSLSGSALLRKLYHDTNLQGLSGGSSFVPTYVGKTGTVPGHIFTGGTLPMGAGGSSQTYHTFIDPDAIADALRDIKDKYSILTGNDPTKK